MSRLRSLLLAAAATFSLLGAASAQQLIPSTLPSCAQQCSLLIQVDQTCESNPPAAQSCLCQTTLLAGVKTNPSNNLCSGFCSDSDWAAIAQWYASTCANGGSSSGSTLATVTTPATGGASTAAVQANTSGQPASTASATLSATAAVSAANAGSTAASSSDGDSSTSTAANYSNAQQWWQTHYQWIIMVIVLLIVFSILGIGGAILFRRHKRRRDLGSMSGSNVSMWNPNASAHAIDQAAGAQLAQNAGKSVMATEKNDLGTMPPEGNRQGPKDKSRVGVLKKVAGR